MKVCKNCGEINSNDSEFCCNCGKKSFVYQEEIRCPHCGELNDKTFEHCIFCGGALHTHSHGEDAPATAHATPAPVDLREEMTTVYGTPSSETARCPHCNAIVPVTAVFCFKCGTSVASLHEHRIIQRRVCPHCGRLNPLDSPFCSYCFANLIDAGTEDLQITHESQNHGELIIRQTVLEGLHGKNLICPNCNTINPDKEVFCVNCGLKLEIEPVKKYCPNCGSENSADSEFCSKCRWSFEGVNPDENVKWACAYCHHVNGVEDAYCSHCGQKRKDEGGLK